MDGSFEKRYPNVAGWVQNGCIEIGRDGYSRSLIRVLDPGGLVWEGKERFETVDDTLNEAEAAIAARTEP